MSVHEGRVDGPSLVVDQSSDLRPPSKVVPLLDKELRRHLLIRDDDELLPQHTRLVNGTELIGPLLKLEP